MADLPSCATEGHKQFPICSGVLRIRIFDALEIELALSSRRGMEIEMKKEKAILSVLCCTMASLLLINEAKADGTEQLGPPSIPIAPGSYVEVAGIGLNDAQPDDISIAIPPGVSVEQVLLYWAGRQTADPGNSDTIQVNGMDVTGPRIGGPTLSPFPSSCYRADITASNWVVAGAVNVLSVGGLDFAYQNDGAAVVVILDDGTAAEIQIADGNDFAYLPLALETVPVDIAFAASADPRVGELTLIVTDIDVPRPAAVAITVDGVTTQLVDVLDNAALGDFMQVVELDVPVPAGVTNVTVQILSIDDETELEPASLSWIAATWSLHVSACGGGGLTPGFWQNKHGLRFINEYGALADLNELCLRDDDGNHADFATLQEFRTWIKMRRATNMAYQLSGHLAAMYMNVLVGSVNGDALVYIGYEGDMISINDLLDEANEALCEDGETFEGDENRDYQERLKNALDKANNNQNWVNPCSTCSY